MYVELSGLCCGQKPMGTHGGWLGITLPCTPAGWWRVDSMDSMAARCTEVGPLHHQPQSDKPLLDVHDVHATHEQNKSLD